MIQSELERCGIEVSIHVGKHREEISIFIAERITRQEYYVMDGGTLILLGVFNSTILTFCALAMYACAYGFSNEIEETLEQTLPDSEYLAAAVSVISTIDKRAI
ncbi:MAG: hypothetical protein RR998_06865 [Oscillospiraceae bacterium]